MSLYYVRHGQTNWNAEYKLQGRNDIPLNEQGIKQAQKTKELFKEIHIDKIFCSPLIRAQQTAKEINKITKCEIVTENRLEERCFGELEGMDMKLNHGYLWSFEKPLCPGAESMPDFFKRVQSFLEEKKEDIKNKNYLIVAHGGVYLPIHEYFKGLDRNQDLMKIVPKNCTVTKFDMDERK